MDIKILTERIYQCTREKCGKVGRIDGQEFVLQLRGESHIVVHAVHGKKGTRCTWRKDLNVVPSTEEREEAPFARGDRVRVDKVEALVLSCKKGRGGWHIEVVVNTDMTCPDIIESGVTYRVGQVHESEARPA